MTQPGTLSLRNSRLALLVTTLLILLTPLTLAHLESPWRRQPIGMNITVPKPGLVVDSLASTPDGVKMILKNTSHDPLPLTKLAISLEAPISLSCTITTQSIQKPINSCNYISAQDTSFKPITIQPGGTYEINIAFTGNLELAEPTWTGNATLTVNAGNYTFTKKLALTASLQWKTHQPSQRAVTVALAVTGNNTLRVTLNTRLYIPHATISSIISSKVENFAGITSLREGALDIRGTAIPPAKLNLTFSLEPAEDTTTYTSQPLLSLGAENITLGSIALPAGKAVNLKPAFGFFPYILEIEVLEGGDGFILVSVGPTIYNVTLSKGHGTLIMSQAFWPLLAVYEAKPITIMLREANSVQAYSAQPDSGVTVVTGLATLLLLITLIAVLLIYNYKILKYKKTCQPITDIELE
ncbi:MAG: hypothetical protein ABWK01_07680 [Infirmifilum sp.]